MPAKKQPAPDPDPKSPPTCDVATLARLFSVTGIRIQQLANDGVIFRSSKRGRYDLWRSIKGYIEFLQKNRYAASGKDEKSGITDAKSVELAELIEQVKAARTYNDARTLNIQIQALRAGYALECDQRKHIEVNLIHDLTSTIGAVVRASIIRLQADLPPMLDGMTPGQMKTLIGEKTDEILRNLSDASNDLWKEIENNE